MAPTGNRHPSKPFVKGDPRINRKGRPKTFNGVRDLARAIAHEVRQDKETGQVIPYLDETGKPTGVTVVEKILRDWAESDNPNLQRAFIEYAFGKVPDRDIVEQSGEVVIRVLNSADSDGSESVPDAPSADDDFVSDDDTEDIDE